jgi:hypothetical protein
MNNMTKRCEHSDGCLNFRRKGHTFCSKCQCLIDMNHFHSVSRCYRLCESCFKSHIDKILNGTFYMNQKAYNEPETCIHTTKCIPPKHSIYLPKLCSSCRTYPHEHFHNISSNTRTCLNCYSKWGK